MAISGVEGLRPGSRPEPARAAAVRLGARTGGLLLAAALSAATVCALVGEQVVLHPGRGVVGGNPSADFQIMTWSLEWWPWAAAHGVDPLHTQLLWPPHGFSTLWMTTIPVPALLALPLTLTAGPLVAYNVLMLAAVVLAAGAAYLLCFELTGRLAPSLLGAGVFALSPYMLGHTLSQHLDLTFVFPLPLLALLVVRRLRRKMSLRRFAAGFALLLLVLAGSSLELLVDLTLVLALMAPFALLLGRSRRRPLLRLGGEVALAYAACLPVFLPVAALGLGQAHGAVQSAPSDYSVDLLNVLVPTPTPLLGALAPVRSLSAHFVGNVGERDGYVGLPLLAVALAALWTRRPRGAWAAGLLVGVALALSLGPTLTAGGRALLTLPLSSSGLPVAGDALPARMSIFASLGLACLAAGWLAAPGRRWLRVVAAVLVVVSLVPDFAPPRRVVNAWAVSNAFAWSTARPPAGFVDARGWRSVVPPGATVLVLPTRDRSASGWWQAETGMAFRLAVPETPFLPPSLAADPTVVGLADGDLPQLEGTTLAAARLRAFVASEGVGAVVVTPAAGPAWRAVVRRAFPTRPRRLAGSLVFRVPHALPAASATGELASARAAASGRALAGRRSGPTLQAWLDERGGRARLRVLLRLGSRPAHARTLSAAGADAEAPAAAVDRTGHAAVVFLEWRDGVLRLRAATSTRGRAWRLATLDSGGQPIWSPQVVLTRTGTILAAWIDERAPMRVLRVAAFDPGRGWERPVTLDSGDGLGALSLAPAGARAVAAWHDSLAGESRVRAATYAAGRWHPALLAAALQPLGAIALEPGGGEVRWQRRAFGERWLAFRADRRGVAWGPAHPLRNANREADGLAVARHPGVELIGHYSNRSDVGEPSQDAGC